MGPLPVTIDYLRISVTDRCNLRCVYCNPLGDVGFVPPEEILTYEEILHLARLFVLRGVRKIRLTGGEPLVRKGIVDLVAALASIAGVEDLAMTTNGVLLAQYADQLRQAGLHRVNISIDSVDRGNYRAVTGFDLLDQVTAGVQRAIAAGLSPVKVNAVVLRGVNESQVLPLVDLGRRHGLIVRFIEYSPTDRNTRPATDHVPTAEIRTVIEKAFGPLKTLVVPSAGGPAVYYRLPGSEATVGFISGRSSVFCHTCNRIRLTSRGHLRPCLYAPYACDLKALLRRGAGDDTLLKAIDSVCTRKKAYTKTFAGFEEFSMRSIGG